MSYDSAATQPMNRPQWDGDIDAYYKNDLPEWVRYLMRLPDKLSMYDKRRFDSISPPHMLKRVNFNETRTNARIKRYLRREVLQCSNDDIFPTADWEDRHGKKRLYDVPPAGAAADPARSLEESKRRAKSKVRDIALCNEFSHMFTWTLDPDVIDRYSPNEVYKKIRAFLSNVTQRKDFRYVAIPEYHELKEGEENPAIHFHGLCSLGAVTLTPSIRKDGLPRHDGSGRQIYNMDNWKFGWSTCVELDENYEKAVNYIAKYITKGDKKIFGKWYLSSRSLRKSPDIIPLERMDFNDFRDEEKIENGEQFEMTVYRDVKIVSEIYD